LDFFLRVGWTCYVFYAQADAAHKKLADDWALSRRDIERRLKRVPDQPPRS